MSPALLTLLLAAPAVETALETRFATDPRALELAKGLYARDGHVVTQIPRAEDFEGGYRGVIRIVPDLPVGENRKHLELVDAAITEFDGFFAAVEKAAGKAPKYRFKDLELRFFRSIKKKTPAAFATGWVISYNMNGTLNGSLRQVRSLMFHELFHSNDGDHDDWSAKALDWNYKFIKVKCGTNIECLTPFAPDPLIVRGGTYYSFMPGNDVREYAADLAVRYFKETTDVLAGKTVKAPFKCGAEQNASAWKALADEFFAGVDLVPACGTKMPK
jgi:hypothetical protein